MDLDVREYGAGKTIRRKYRVVNYMGDVIDSGRVLHKKVMGKDNPYRQGAELSDGAARLRSHIKDAWLSGGGVELEPPDHAEIVINRNH